MTYNAEFLWDGIEAEDGSSRVDFPWRGDPETARQHMEKMAGVIREANADIVLLQEVEDEAALRRLNAMLEDQDYETQLVQGKDTFNRQDVAMLTRLEPSRVYRINAEGESGGESSQVTKNLVATFDLGGESIAVITAHFIARPDDRSRQHKREAQADALRDAAVDLRADGYSIIIAGDLNDYDPDVPDVAEALDPIAGTLTILKQMDPDTHQAERRTAWWDRDRSGDITRADVFTAIHHVLLSPELFQRLEAIDVPRHDVMEVSDHLPVVVQIRF